MGGKDVYMKQQHSSVLQPADIQKRLQDIADKRFLDTNGQYTVASEQVYQNNKLKLTLLFKHDTLKGFAFFLGIKHTLLSSEGSCLYHVGTAASVIYNRNLDTGRNTWGLFLLYPPL